jgi:hypothetical protein
MTNEKKWILVDEKSGGKIVFPVERETFRGEKVTVSGGAPPLNENSTGRIYIDRSEYYPGVVGLEWTREEVLDAEIPVGVCRLCGKPKKRVEHIWCPDCLKQCEDVYDRKIECDDSGHLFSRHNIARAKDGNGCRKLINRKDTKHGQDPYRL